eukprot:8906141-Alexandrium_andersonii.AAC.1
MGGPGGGSPAGQREETAAARLARQTCSELAQVRNSKVRLLEHSPLRLQLLRRLGAAPPMGYALHRG